MIILVEQLDDQALGMILQELSFETKRLALRMISSSLMKNSF